jgi:hypothetical protein
MADKPIEVNPTFGTEVTPLDQPTDQFKRISQADILPAAIKPRHLYVNGSAGDLYYSDGTNFTRLPVGTANQVLTMVGGVPTWGTPASIPSYNWTSFNPSWTNLTVGNGTNTGFYCQIGKIIFVQVSFVFGSGSSMGTNPVITPPVAAASTASIMPCGKAIFLQHGVGYYEGVVDNGITIYQFGPSGSTVKLMTITPTSPWTWATTDNICISLSYQAS